MPPPTNPIITFGEILWDCLPQGLFPGGAPFNVAACLARMDQPAAIISAVGADFLGEEIVRRAQRIGVGTELISRNRERRTGTVQVELSADAQASYTITRNAAWDDLTASRKVLAAVRTAPALVFGSLAARSSRNRQALQQIRAVCTGLQVMDVNLRPPFADLHRVRSLMQQVDLIKLNHEELHALTDCGTNARQLRKGAAELSATTGARGICITRGARGALLLWDEHYYGADSPKVTVKDTIGAGDAFTASLLNDLLRSGLEPDPDQMLQRACAVGAYVTSQHGAVPEGLSQAFSPAQS